MARLFGMLCVGLTVGLFLNAVDAQDTKKLDVEVIFKKKKDESK